MLTASERALNVAELRKPKLLREVGVEPELRTPGIDEEADLAAVHAHADHRQRSSVQEFEARGLPVAVHIIRRLAVEALQLRNVQGRILLDDQLIGADLDSAERRRRL